MADLPGTIAQRDLPDGRVLAVYPLLTGTARLTVSSVESIAYGVFDDGW